MNKSTKFSGLNEELSIYRIKFDSYRKAGSIVLQETDLHSEENFISAVESAINALEHNGLDCCRDQGAQGFERYVAFAVLARNLQTQGGYVRERKLFLQKRKQKLRETWGRKKCNAA